MEELQFFHPISLKCCQILTKIARNLFSLTLFIMEGRRTNWLSESFLYDQCPGLCLNFIPDPFIYFLCFTITNLFSVCWWNYAGNLKNAQYRQAMWNILSGIFIVDHACDICIRPIKMVPYDLNKVRQPAARLPGTNQIGRHIWVN